VQLRLLGQAVAMFAVTNIDDILVLALFFARAGTDRVAALRVVAGQYLGFAAILALSVTGALGAGLLPTSAIPYLGLFPLLLGLRAARSAWREHRGSDDDTGDGTPGGRVGMWQVGAVTLANGGDNIGVYIPVFAVTGPSGLSGYLVVFLIGVALWCAAGYFFATRAVLARTLGRWGHLILPVVLIAIGLLILIEGGVFGL
jgi:cadmium resistance protein CadD (predicted permease)